MAKTEDEIQLSLEHEMPTLLELLQTQTEGEANACARALEDRWKTAARLIAQKNQKIKELREWNEKLSAELDRGDSWEWIRNKFEKCGKHLTWWTPRNDGLKHTRYEVMGWLHVLFAEAHPHVYIDICMEQQKRAEAAEAEILKLQKEIERLRKPRIITQKEWNGPYTYMGMRSLDTVNQLIENLNKTNNEEVIEKCQPQHGKLQDVRTQTGTPTPDLT